LQCHSLVASWRNSITSSAAIRDETSALELVVVGTAADKGPFQLHNPTIRQHVEQGTAPSDHDLNEQVEGFGHVLEKRGVKVLRPLNVGGVLQTFVRDLGFVVGDTFVWCNLKKEKRRLEQDGLRPAIDQLEGVKTVSPPADILIEGGDVVLLKGKLLVGIGEDPERARTSSAAAKFLQETFPDMEIIPVATRASDSASDDPKEHVLHLDCAFQPIGVAHGIFFEPGFARRPDAIFDLIGDENLIRVSADEMFRLWPNLLSLSPDCVVSAPSFGRLNARLRKLDITVLEVPYEEVAKLGGLFRCSTLPIRRRPPS
jgi:N-dimethylarginine dimethylaminohydrolase